MIGAYYLSVFLGSVISGRLGALYERLTAFELWSMHAALCTLGGAVLLVIGSVRTRAVPVAQQTAFAQHESN